MVILYNKFEADNAQYLSKWDLESQNIETPILGLAHVIEQPIFQILNLEYLQLNFCFDLFNDSENTFWGFFEI